MIYDGQIAVTTFYITVCAKLITIRSIIHKLRHIFAAF